MLRSLRMSNVLSFGQEAVEIDLGPLNVFIGVNGAGKSNLLEVINLLGGAPRDLSAPIRDGGGVLEWLWKNGKNGSKRPAAVVNAVVDHGPRPLRYHLAFTEVGQRFEVTEEHVESLRLAPKRKPITYYRYDGGKPIIKMGKLGMELTGIRLDLQKSILAQVRDPKHYPELHRLEQAFSSIRLYRDWSLGRGAPVRMPQLTDLPNDFLMEDGRNLGLVLNRLRRVPETRGAILEHLRLLYDGITDVDVSVEGGTVQVFLQEGSRTIPAARLSDGTLRWLALLTILLHPDPPELVCIEEPELGLHPDILPALTTLLRAASSRMQLIVTTHSDAIADALTDSPECVVVCEKDEGATRFRRLDRDTLSTWLQQYSLGELWRRGELGGNRW